jgi:hypothetical protein
MKKHSQLGVQTGFYEKATDASKKKQQIAVAYFESYMNVMARHGRTAQYADLFAGPGVYDDGDKSIPILICEKVIADERLRKHVRLWFNEGDPDLKERLAQNIAGIPGVSTLTHSPGVTKIVISPALGPKLESRLKATFVFADPCGYKGLSGDGRIDQRILRGDSRTVASGRTENNLISRAPGTDRASCDRGCPERSGGSVATCLRVSDSRRRWHQPPSGFCLEGIKRRDDYEALDESGELANY